MSARIYGDCVIASTKSSMKGSYKGRDFSGDYYFVHVWVKEGEEWKLANSQATKLSAEKIAP
jgi:ketosteroid isomerase-like protein